MTPTAITKQLMAYQRAEAAKAVGKRLDVLDAPLVRGGQGRTPKELRESPALELGVLLFGVLVRGRK